MNCTSCGKQLNPGARFCNACGAAQSTGAAPMPGQPQQPAQQQSQQSTGPYDTPQVRALLGTSADGFIKEFNKMTATGKQVSWNWAGFFLGFIWMLVRKPFGNTEAYVAFGASIILSIVSLFILTDMEAYMEEWWYWPFVFIGLTVFIWIGCRFNYWKMLSVDKQLRQ